MASSSYNPTATAKAESGGEPEVMVVVPMPNKGSDEVYRGLKKGKKERGCTAKERISKMPPCTAGKRSSIYRGVTRHRWTGRYEAHLWDKSTWNQNQNKKGKQVYLGAYDDEEAAARAYDLAALKYWGPGTLINFPVTDYTRDLEEMQNLSREEYLASLRRKSSGFSRGVSKYRPLSSNRWDPYFGRGSGADYFNSTSYGAGDKSIVPDEYIGSLSFDRKIDLTNYIKWWGVNKLGEADSHNKSSEEMRPSPSEDFGAESKLMAWSNLPTEPYEMPRLGMSLQGKDPKRPSASALSILLRSAAYNSLLEKGSKRKAIDENYEDKHRNGIHRMNHGKGVEKSSHDAGNERFGSGNDGLTLQTNAPFPSFPSFFMDGAI